MGNELKVLYIGRVIRALGSCQPIEEGLIILLLRLTRILPPDRSPILSIATCALALMTGIETKTFL